MESPIENEPRILKKSSLAIMKFPPSDNGKRRSLIQAVTPQNSPEQQGHIPPQPPSKPKSDRTKRTVDKVASDKKEASNRIVEIVSDPNVDEGLEFHDSPFALVDDDSVSVNCEQEGAPDATPDHALLPRTFITTYTRSFETGRLFPDSPAIATPSSSHSETLLDP